MPYCKYAQFHLCCGEGSTLCTCISADVCVCVCRLDADYDVDSGTIIIFTFVPQKFATVLC